jgi:hypothetical protein
MAVTHSHSNIGILKRPSATRYVDHGALAATLRADPAGWPNTEVHLARRPALRYENGTTRAALHPP